MHRGFWALGALLIGLGTSDGARAASLSWSAPAACPGAEEVKERVGRALSADLGSLPEVAFEAKVSPTAEGYELRLTVRRHDAVSERRIRGKTCPELVDALEAAMSLAIQSLSPSETETPSPPPTEEPSEPSAPPPAAETPAEEAPAPRPPPAKPTRRGPGLSPSVSLGGLLDVGTLPQAAFGVKGAFGLGFGWFRPSIYGAWIPPQRSPVRGSSTEQVEYDLIAGGIDLCALSREGWWEIRGCLGGEVGNFRGKGVNLDNPQSGSFLWGAIVPEAVALAHPGRQIWAPFVTVGAVLPLNRRNFVLTNEGFVHRPAALSLRVGLGIELEFR